MFGGCGSLWHYKGCRECLQTVYAPGVPDGGQCLVEGLVTVSYSDLEESLWNEN